LARLCLSSSLLAAWLVTQEGPRMIAWISALLAGAALLAGFAIYLCRRPREYRRLTRGQLAELQVLSDIERYENLR
jgi:uncharacterized membrane protein